MNTQTGSVLGDLVRVPQHRPTFPLNAASAFPMYIPHGYAEVGNGSPDRLCQQSKPGRAAPQGGGAPKGVHQVEIIRLGSSRLITPVGRRWDEFFANGPYVSEDMMNERDQPSAEEREPL